MTPAPEINTLQEVRDGKVIEIHQYVWITLGFFPPYPGRLWNNII